MSQALYLSLIISVAVGIHVSLTSPTPTAPKNRRVMGDYPGILYIALLILKYSCWAHATIELFIILVSELVLKSPSTDFTQWLNNNIPHLFLPNNKEGMSVFLSPSRTIGGISVMLGSLIRYACYRELGRHFTYHVSLLQNHHLVTTGPYSIVRHPAYIGGDLVQVGLVVWHASSGAWLRESKVYTKTATWLVIFPALYAVGSILVMYYRRLIVEDEMLKKEFGKKWDEWAKKVPYRLVPGIY
ncbi:hypothetical protein BJ912DRAFT_930763 [Pholiota molesta]|nr:hypothetical protein BJ912DRAFT_930763 [Pholiota molesta]